MGTRAVAALPLCLLLACSEAAPTSPEPTSHGLSLHVAPLALPGVADGVWDVLVENGADPREPVVGLRLVASRYGTGQGSVAYVAPCDASPGASENQVTVTLLGLYGDADAATLAEDLAAADALGYGEGAAAFACPDGPLCGLAFMDPGPLVKTFPCTPNADTPVDFDVTVMRQANQGFFDVAVSFDAIFCAAKLDCCDVAGDPGGDPDACDRPAEDIELLFRGGERATTIVLGLVCTAGIGSDVETHLLTTALSLV